MQMIHAAGFPILYNRVPNTDQHNPRGYYEFEMEKRKWMAADNREYIGPMNGKVVKMFPQQFSCLNPDFNYQFIWVERPIHEVATSQRKMLSELPKRSPNEVVPAFLAKLRFHALIYVSYFRHIIIQHANLYDGSGAESIYNFLTRDTGRGPIANAALIDMYNCVDSSLRHWR
jgi:hypothetical protein